MVRALHRVWIQTHAEVHGMTMQRPPGRAAEDPTTISKAESAQALLSESESGRWPSIDMFREGSRLVIAADLPGVAAEQITVRVSAQEIRLIGERTAPSGGGERVYDEHERRFGRFERAIRLPRPIRPHTVTAHVEGGVLTCEAELAASSGAGE
jgi:HSP20 family molecular chaperone IbpA